MICKNCKQEIDNKADVCVHCGCKVKKPIYKKWWFWCIIVIVVVVIASSGGEEKTNTNSVNDSVVTEQQEKKEVQENTDQGYKKGMYKIGTDMPAGEYVIVSNTMTYVAITSDSSGTFDSIIANDNFNNRTIITVSEGQYLEFNSGKAYPISEAPKVVISNGELKEGMYKVGLDIPAGEYKIASTVSSAYVEISADSSHELASIVSNDNFEGEKYISVSDGQYLKFSRAKLLINN